MAEYKVTQPGGNTKTNPNTAGSPAVTPEDDWEFLHYLGMLYGVDQEAFHFPFLVQDTKNDDGELVQQAKVPCFADWLELFKIVEGSEKPQDASGTLTATMPLVAGSPPIEIKITSTSVTAELDMSDTTAALFNSFKMAALIKANPAHVNGIELEGTEEEKLFLYLAAKKYGFADHIENVPEGAEAFIETQEASIDQIWDQFVAITNHTASADQPANEAGPETTDNDGATDPDEDGLDNEDSQEEEELEADDELDIELTDEAAAYIYFFIKDKVGISPDSKQIEKVWERLGPEDRKLITSEKAQDDIESMKENIQKRLDEADPIETELSDPLNTITKRVVNEMVMKNFGGLQIGEISDSQAEEFWALISEKERNEAKFAHDPELEFIEYAQKLAYKRAYVTLTEEQSRQLWANMSPEDRASVKDNIEDVIADLDYQIADLDLKGSSGQPLKVSEGVQAKLLKDLSEIIPVSDISDEQLAEYYHNNFGGPGQSDLTTETNQDDLTNHDSDGGITDLLAEDTVDTEPDADPAQDNNQRALPGRPERPALPAATTDELDPITDQSPADGNEQTAGPVAQLEDEPETVTTSVDIPAPHKQVNTHPDVSKAAQTRLRVFLRESFGNAALKDIEAFRRTWNKMDATQQQALIDAVGVKDTASLGKVAAANFGQNFGPIFDRHISDNAFKVLNENGVDEDTYRLASAIIIEKQDARFDAAKDATGLSATKTKWVLKALDAEGITTFKPGSARTLNVNPDGSLVLTKKAFTQAAARPQPSQPQATNSVEALGRVLDIENRSPLEEKYSVAVDSNNLPAHLATEMSDSFSTEYARDAVRDWHNKAADEKHLILSVLQYVSKEAENEISYNTGPGRTSGRPTIN